MIEYRCNGVFDIVYTARVCFLVHHAGGMTRKRSRSRQGRPTRTWMTSVFDLSFPPTTRWRVTMTTEEILRTSINTNTNTNTHGP